jgi:hypothetical protein
VSGLLAALKELAQCEHPGTDCNLPKTDPYHGAHARSRCDACGAQRLTGRSPWAHVPRVAAVVDATREALESVDAPDVVSRGARAVAQAIGADMRAVTRTPKPLTWVSRSKAWIESHMVDPDDLAALLVAEGLPVELVHEPPPQREGSGVERAEWWVREKGTGAFFVVSQEGAVFRVLP